AHHRDRLGMVALDLPSVSAAESLVPHVVREASHHRRLLQQEARQRGGILEQARVNRRTEPHLRVRRDITDCERDVVCFYRDPCVGQVSERNRGRHRDLLGGLKPKREPEELKKETAIIRDKGNPVRFYNYSYVKEILEKKHKVKCLCRRSLIGRNKW